MPSNSCPLLCPRFTDRFSSASLAGIGTNWLACDVRVNELQNLPHREGQLVLDVVAPDREVKVFVRHGRYWVDCAITCGLLIYLIVALPLASARVKSAVRIKCTTTTGHSSIPAKWPAKPT